MLKGPSQVCRCKVAISVNSVRYARWEDRYILPSATLIVSTTLLIILYLASKNQLATKSFNTRLFITALIHQHVSVLQILPELKASWPWYFSTTVQVTAPKII